MTNHDRSRRGGLRTSAAVALVVTAALGLQGCGDAATTAPPSNGPSSTSTPSPTATSASPSASPTATQAAPAPTKTPELSVMEASKPASLVIPTIGVQSELVHLGQRSDGTLEVPTEGPGSPASWYTQSPTPGERGPAVMLGHVNATGGGPGVFAKLRELKSGDEIKVPRDDGSTAVFVVDKGVQYEKDDFPTLEVYGNTPGSELRLITCDGYQESTGLWDYNYVVYAKLKV
ncbi:class F sortase [Arthrobacter roseus]|uniref:class F sortase n=1 Tax=Arthrobacter roseus TaxID=136274 RepID=UPI001964697C|nr:class F sortase [Arthrobacter roseus]MBM7847943.1 sortase (surface protein transpeptidase) [Arthrobacter roseus]